MHGPNSKYHMPLAHCLLLLLLLLLLFQHKTIHADAGTDPALGEMFAIDVPAGLDTVQLEVIAKHTLTGDDHIGTATISMEAVKVRSSSQLLTLTIVQHTQPHSVTYVDNVALSGWSAPAVAVEPPHV